MIYIKSCREKYVSWEDSYAYYFTGNDTVAIFVLIAMMIEVFIEEKAISFLESFLDELELEALTFFFSKFRKN